VPAPPGREAAALIDAVTASGDGSTIAGEDIVLRGMVSRISLEKKTGRIFGTILVGDLPFTVKLTPQLNGEHTVFPGREIFIRYRLDRIKWI
jgi:hypothetical protein